MIIKNVNLETVCGITSAIPDNLLDEVAFARKSNVGKSSLINALMNRKSLARTSSQPGKTQTINFYNVNEAMYLVDLEARQKTAEACEMSWHFPPELLPGKVLPAARYFRHDPAPGKAHPVNLQAQLGHQVHILFPVVVMIGSHLVVGDAGAACPQVGGGNALAAFVVTALYLKGAGRRAPEEIGGENHLFCQVDNTSLFDFMVSRSQTLSKSFWEKPNR